ncbi:mannose-1-phosphate guanylyltransferase [Enterococcus avium]|nr:mannose-1-phosphate guanylyltransferase [Enterococcus avium]
MKIILLSGGSGKRLWPLSNNQRSKQFIKILRDDKGNLESMVQRVWRQLTSLGLENEVFIATSESQRSILKSQLKIKNDQIITEPSRKDTFPAIALATTYLNTVIGVSKNETIVVLPVDPYVQNSFFKKIMELEDLLEKKQTSLGLIGISPTYPSEKYGYIVPESIESNMVQSFTEKPIEKKAEELISRGAVWNAGVFAFKISTILEFLENKGFSTNYFDLVDKYISLPKNSFDFEFVEKQESISFLRYSGCWKDLGTWNTLIEEMEESTVGPVETIDTLDTHVVNESELPVAVIGTTNLVIAVGPEGILVSTKDASPRVKEIDNNYFETINYIEEDWGVRHTLHESCKSKATHYKIRDGKKIHLDLKINERIIRLSGEGTISNNKLSYDVLGHDEFNFVIVTES